MKSVPDIIHALSIEGVSFVLVGGFAVQMHGFLRATYDLDLVLAMDDANLSRFIDIGKRFGLTPVIPVSIDALRDSAQIERWYKEKGMIAFALRDPSISGSVLDILVRPEIPFDRLRSQADTFELFGCEVAVACIDHLIEMKRTANRPKDRIDIEALEKIKRGESANE